MDCCTNRRCHAAWTNAILHHLVQRGCQWLPYSRTRQSFRQGRYTKTNLRLHRTLSWWIHGIPVVPTRRMEQRKVTLTPRWL